MKIKLVLFFLLLSAFSLNSVYALQKTSINSNKASSYTDEPKRMFVVTNIGTDFGEDFANSFQKIFSAKMKNCKVETGISRIVIYDRAAESRLMQMKEFDPDTQLSIMRNGGVQRQLALISVIYDMKLIDLKTNAMVWRAEVNFEKGDADKLGQRGEVLATDLIEKLEADQILRSCGY